MKRVLTLDFIRGFAMLFLVAFHAFEKLIYSAFYGELFNLPVYIIVPIGLILQLAIWRGLFMMISGAALIYTLQEAVQKTTNRLLLLFKQIFISILYFLQGMAIQMIWNPYMTFGDVNLRGLLWSDAVETIALCMFITSIIHIILTLGKGKDRYFRNAVIYFVLMVLVFIFTPILIEILQNSLGLTPPDIQNLPDPNWEERLRLMWLAILFGWQQPLFPYLAPYFIGCILGLVLSRPNVPKKQTLIGGFIAGLFFVLAGGSLWISEGATWAGAFMIPPTWLFLFITGCQIWLIFLFLKLIEFGPNISKAAKNTKIFRRAGLLSLSMFTFQQVDYIPRWIMTKLTGEDYITRGGLSLEMAIIISIVVLFFWIGLLLLFGLLRNYGTIEFFFTLIKHLIDWKKVNWRDPLNQTNIIVNVDPVHFVPDIPTVSNPSK